MMGCLFIILVVLTLALGAGGTLAAEAESSISGTFTPAGSLAEARFGHTATPLPDGLPDGRVLVVGGSDLTDRLASAEVWESSDG